MVEYRPFKARVEGSSPSGPTTYLIQANARKEVTVPCDCGNCHFGFNCSKEWQTLHPGTTWYACEFCGLYQASAPMCNKCELQEEETKSVMKRYEFQRRSPFSGKIHTMTIQMTEQQFAELSQPNGRHIQDILPHCTPDEREFIMTGITPEEWEQTFGKK